jgi:hypothetical protein
MNQNKWHGNMVPGLADERGAEEARKAHQEGGGGGSPL